MIDTKKGAGPSSATSPLILDLTGRLKKNVRSSQVRKLAKSEPVSTMIYVFPSRRVHTTRSETPSPAGDCAQVSHRFPRWLTSFTGWHGLIAGAIACYVLIVCNLIYGLTSMAQLKVWRPLQGATISEIQRRVLPPPVECDQGQRLSAGGAAVAPLTSVLCSADKSFSDVLDELFPRGMLVGEPRPQRIH